MRIGDTALRISSDSVRAADAVRKRFSSLVVDEDALLGFALTSPSGRNRIYVLTDRCGFVMGRSRKFDDILSILAGLLGSLLPQPDNAHRFRLRAIAREDSVYLCVPPVLFSEPPIERQFARAGFSVVDRLVADIDVRTLKLVNAYDGVGALEAESGRSIGHMSPSPSTSFPIAGILVPGNPLTGPPSVGAVVADLAACSVSGSIHEALATARRLASLKVHAVHLGVGGLREIIASLQLL